MGKSTQMRGMDELNEMIKRRKDEGFTLIELMIVIAVIGILAIVLVPKVGSVKTQAKGAGLDTNIRVVEGYAHSKIDRWVSKGLTPAQVQADIKAAFTSTNDQLTNPLTSLTAPAGSGPVDGSTNESIYVLNTIDGSDLTVNSAETRGTVAVSVIGAVSGPITSVKIFAHGNVGEALSEKEVEIKP